VPEQHPARGEYALADRGLPVGAAGGRIDLPDDDVHHAVQELLLAGHVLAERHRDNDRQGLHAARNVTGGLVAELNAALAAG
jgi:hypothetical protein